MLDRLPLLGGSYSARSVLASAQRCVNYYPEKNPPGSLVPFTYYQRPGKVPLVQGPAAPVRALYQSTLGTGYCVIGSKLYRLEPDWSLRELGDLAPGRTNLCSLQDNGKVLMVVDGSGQGWQTAIAEFEVLAVGNVYNTDVIDHLVSGLSATGANGLAVGMEVSANKYLPIGARVVEVLSEDSVRISVKGTAHVAKFHGSITATTLTVDEIFVGSDPIELEMFLLSPEVGSVALGSATQITAFGSGSGGVGTYTVSVSQAVPAQDMVGTMGGQLDLTFTAGEDLFAPISDSTGTFTGADRVDHIDTFMLWNIPGTNEFGSTLSGVPLLFDGSYIAAKADYPDLLQTLIVNRHEILLLGLQKSEIWYDAGNPLFPFAELPGAFIEHGVLAKYSVAAADISVFWLSNNLQGTRMVLRQRGYQTTRISNHALEDALRRVPDCSDAIGFCYQIDGHVFYQLTLPSGDQTWVFDDSIGEPELAWHQEAWQSPADGLLHRDRANCFASLYGRLVVGDWENGTLYALDLDTYSDTVSGVQSPITCIRTFPHPTHASRQGRLEPVHSRPVLWQRFWADLECGNSPVDVQGHPALVTLRWSDDRGRTWGQDVLQSAGGLGEYQTQPAWPGLGQSRYRVFELSHSINGAAALNGALVEGDIAEY